MSDVLLVATAVAAARYTLVPIVSLWLALWFALRDTAPSEREAILRALAPVVRAHRSWPLSRS